MMKIGLVQAPSLKDANANLKIIERYAKEAKDQGCMARFKVAMRESASA